MLPVIKRVDYIADPDKLVLTPTLRRDLVKRWIDKMVNKTKESSALSVWAAPVLLGLVLSYTVYNGQQMASDVRELNKAITILQTQKEEQEKIHERDRLQAKQDMDEQRIRRENLENRLNQLEYIIKSKKGG